MVRISRHLINYAEGSGPGGRGPRSSQPAVALRGAGPGPFGCAGKRLFKATFRSEDQHSPPFCFQSLRSHRACSLQGRERHSGNSRVWGKLCGGFVLAEKGEKRKEGEEEARDTQKRGGTNESWGRRRKQGRGNVGERKTRAGPSDGAFSSLPHAQPIWSQRP